MKSPKIGDFGANMNPHTYANMRRSSVGSSETRVSALSLLKELIHTPLQPLLALAVVVMSTSAVIALASVVLSEQKAADYVAFDPIVRNGHVLGETIVNQAQVTDSVPPTSLMYESVTLFAGKYLTLTAKPIAYSIDQGKWNYTISWQRAKSKSGSIYINGNVFVKEATGTSEQATGFTLKPGTSYKVVFYEKVGGKGVKVANRTLTTLEDEEQPEQEDMGDGLDDKGHKNDGKLMPIKVTSPKGDATWKLGTTQTISWSSTASGSPVYIALEMFPLPPQMKCGEGKASSTLSSSAPVHGGAHETMKVEVKDQANETKCVNLMPQLAPVIIAKGVSGSSYDWTVGNTESGQNVKPGKYRVIIYQSGQCQQGQGAKCPSLMGQSGVLNLMGDGTQQPPSGTGSSSPTMLPSHQ